MAPPPASCTSFASVSSATRSCFGMYSMPRSAKASRIVRDISGVIGTGAAIGPGFMANLHVAFASPNARFVEYVLAPNNVRSELLTEPVTLADGFIERPTAPGLGITLDAGFAERYPYRPGIVEYA